MPNQESQTLNLTADINYPNNLPVHLTRFIGREYDIAEVKKLLIAHRLVTLTGPGGCGKTRLALQIASDLLPAYEQGIWLVEFAPLSDPAFIAQAVAAVVGIREYPGVELSQAVLDHLSSRHILLVFDNCEHLTVHSLKILRNPEFLISSGNEHRPDLNNRTNRRFSIIVVRDAAAGTA